MIDYKQNLYALTISSFTVQTRNDVCSPQPWTSHTDDWGLERDLCMPTLFLYTSSWPPPLAPCQAVLVGPQCCWCLGELIVQPIGVNHNTINGNAWSNMKWAQKIKHITVSESDFRVLWLTSCTFRQSFEGSVASSSAWSQAVSRRALRRNFIDSMTSSCKESFWRWSKIVFCCVVNMNFCSLTWLVRSCIIDAWSATYPYRIFLKNIG